MRDRVDVQIADLLRRVGLIEIELHGSGDSVARLLQSVQSEVKENSTARELLNDLENRIIVLEERVARQQENQNLRKLINLLTSWPGGLWGLFWSLVALNTAIALAIDIIGPSVMLRSLLGL